jgi:Uma2 family endonuclease
MSLPAVSALRPLPFDLVEDDGQPVEDPLHIVQMSFLDHLMRRAMAEQERTDFYCGMNTFVYYSVEQAREVAREVENDLPEKAFRGPDIFFVDGVDPRERRFWVAWEEDGRLPDVVFELMSPSSRSRDRKLKKALYAQTFGTAEYYIYDWDRRKLEGYRLPAAGALYEPMPLDARGRYWSEKLGAAVGLWHGLRDDHEYTWVRLFHADGSLVLTEAEAERQRANAAEAEIARLRALLERAPGDQ